MTHPAGASRRPPSTPATYAPDPGAARDVAPEGIGAVPDPVVGAAAAFIRAHATDPLTVADVADDVGYSEFHFTRLFTAGLGISPGRYLAAVRFQRAKELILTDDLPVVDVCHAVGYNSPGTFTRRFTAEVGVSPAALRRVADRLAGPTLRPFHRGPTPDDPGPVQVVAGPVSAGQVSHGHVSHGQVSTARRHPAQAIAPLVATVIIPVALRPELGDDPLVWVGLFPRPVPAGPPLAGVLRRGDGEVRLPALVGAPWLLATAVRATADPLEHLIPSRPIVGGHPAPVGSGQRVEVVLRHADENAHPLLVALASLAPT